MIRRISVLFLFAFSLSLSFTSRADEGMWLPMLIKRLNYTDMQRLGLKLTPEEIYDVNHSSLKDAILNFGGFCTGEVISKDGLVLTNHHCGYESVQSHSTVQNDYLSNGFWAMSRDKELPNKGLTVSFLVRMEDVTEKVLSSVGRMPSDGRDDKIEKLSKELEEQAVKGTHYNAEVKSFFEGNEFYLFVYETFKDVRLVGAPPSSVGKFGGDTDNWMWPRHTGDFSMFRIYSGPDGKPAEYSKDNIPLKAKYWLPVSLKGVHKNDYSMVLGYPGNTERYIPAAAVSMTYDQSNPIKIRIREKRLALMKEDMDANPEIRIKYASNYAQVSNYYKYFIGQNQGLKRLHIVDKKKEEEKAFTEWVNADPSRKIDYGNLLSDYDKIYKLYRKYNPAYIYLEEAAFGTEVLIYAYHLNSLYSAMKGGDAEELKAAMDEAKKTTEENFKNYNAPTDKKIFAALLKMYYEDIPKELHPAVFAMVAKKYKGDFNRYADDVFKKSMLVSKQKMDAFLAKPDAKLLEKDPAFQAMNSILNDFRAKIGPMLGGIFAKKDQTNAVYTKALMEMKKGQKLYPDANFTMRLTYGTIQDYDPRDAVHYEYFTTLSGVVEKEDSTNDEFVVPPKLIDLYQKKDFGKYADENGIMHVCFISNNDITGGNSGSPVINGEGHLIGTAFDGNWEAMSGDIVYEPGLQRCISVDIRYILFMIDKFAGAGHLIQEMTLIENTGGKDIQIKKDIEPGAPQDDVQEQPKPKTKTK
ncbi:MAG: S46 family peptidase [Cytophagaceae bacterium]